MFHQEQGRKLDDPDRQTWLPSAEVVARLALARGMQVADVGAGDLVIAMQP
jgi:hypothetical protein